MGDLYEEMVVIVPIKNEEKIMSIDGDIYIPLTIPIIVVS